MAIIGTLVSLLGACCKFGECGPEVRLIVCPKRRAEMLRTRMDDLKRNKEATEKAAREKTPEQPWSRMHPNVEAWIESVVVLSARVDEIPQDLPFWKRFCCYHAYKLGDKIEQCLEEIRMKEERLRVIGDNLVFDEFSILDLKTKLHDKMEELEATKKDLESDVQKLELTAGFRPMVMSEGVELWIRRFVSLEKDVSELVEKIESTETAPTAITPNETAASVAPNEAAAAATSIPNEAAATAAPNEATATAALNETTEETVAEIKLKGDTWAMINRVVELSEQLTNLKREGRLVVTVPPQPFHELPGERSDFVVSIEEKLKKVETLLNDGKTKIILIYGMGGSGKTTLVRELTEILRSKGGGGFDFIFSVVVSQNLDIHKIQEEVFVQLGYMRDDRSLPQNTHDRSIFLQTKLNQKSFLLVLDNLWEPLGDLPSKLGFHPFSSSSKKCKVVVTSRKVDVCKRRESIEALKIGFLGKERAWELFCRKSGLVEPDELICSMAKEIVEKCGGLPLVLKTVASAMMKNRNYNEWLHL